MRKKPPFLSGQELDIDYIWKWYGETQFRGALNFRHWLAHGRYWILNASRQYDPPIILDIIENLFNKFPNDFNLQY